MDKSPWDKPKNEFIEDRLEQVKQTKEKLLAKINNYCVELHDLISEIAESLKSEVNSKSDDQIHALRNELVSLKHVSKDCDNDIQSIPGQEYIKEEEEQAIYARNVVTELKNEEEELLQTTPPPPSERGNCGEDQYYDDCYSDLYLERHAVAAREDLIDLISHHFGTLKLRKPLIRSQAAARQRVVEESAGVQSDSAVDDISGPSVKISDNAYPAVAITNKSKEIIKTPASQEKPGLVSKCNDKRCKCCDQIIETTELSVGRPAVIVNANSDLNCKSANLIYLLKCANCSNFYIGQTGDKLHKRVTDHRYRTNKGSYKQKLYEHFRNCSSAMSPPFYVFPFHQLPVNCDKKDREEQEVDFIAQYKPTLNTKNCD